MLIMGVASLDRPGSADPQAAVSSTDSTHLTGKPSSPKPARVGATVTRELMPKGDRLAPSEPRPAPSAAREASCRPGDEYFCKCRGGEDGKRTCGPDGRGIGACVCD